MTQSLDALKRNSENSRAQLTATVDRLKEQITDTAEDLRYKVSAEGIKAEVSEFISHKTQGWLGSLKEQAMANPMQAIAVGTAIAVPVMRLARGFPLPLLMIGAGLALTSKTVRSRAAEMAAPAVEKVQDVMDETAGHAHSLASGMRQAIHSAESRGTDLAGEAADIAADLKDRAMRVTHDVTDNLISGMDAASAKAKEAVERARASAVQAANTAPAAAARVIRDNAALVGGLGVAIGVILAASLPRTRAEAEVLGGASDQVKQAATTAAQSGLAMAKDRVLSAADAATQSFSNAELGEPSRRLAGDMTQRLKEVADDVVTTAFEPSRTSSS
ncbi:DUF3618 domain-containing protein [Bradyrhizobium sp.]|uniref:DUF3618 domain-containing protein n=1 Tax=Bradyrhizobium sp. TaxID=376 RepID=UPI0025BE779A|nr:DUF3618 domain-containing protein [Bradyrhizobium sp.]